LERFGQSDVPKNESDEFAPLRASMTIGSFVSPKSDNFSATLTKVENGRERNPLLSIQHRL
jgi:hypothetical protein